MMILTYIIDIEGMLRLTEVQGHKVKGQGHIYVLCKIIVLAVNHEWIDGC